MLIEINPDTYINPECIEAVKSQITYLGDPAEDSKCRKKVDTVIYTRGGRTFYYDGTLEECVKKLGMEETELREVTPDGTTT